MDIFLQSVGYWNLIGSIFLLVFLKESSGEKILVQWAKIFKEPYKLGYYGRFWLLWAAGLNVFFSLINIMAAHWDLLEMKEFLVITDIIIYLVFIGLGILGYISKKCDVGVFVGLVIFGFWAIWGTWVLV
jgi:hypothetical protein